MKVLLIFSLLYFIGKIPRGYANFFIWFKIKYPSICILNILIPQVVDPAHPPMNIKKRKNINGNFPQELKSEVTYPVPDKTETTLKVEILKFSKKS